MKTTRRQLRGIIREALLLEQAPTGKIYHMANVPIPSLSSRPMWFWMEEELGHILYDRNQQEGRDTYLYEANVAGNIADTSDQEIKDLFEQNGVIDFVGELASNPSEDEVLAFDGTKVLLENGYDGLIFWDYHPGDSQQDAKALIIFNTAKSVSNWKRIK